MNVSTSEPTFTYQFVAGNLALDFANTADWHEAEHPVEMLTSYDDLLRWGRQAGEIDNDTAERLRRVAEELPEAAIDVYERSIRLREALFHIFRLIARQQPAPNDDVAILNNELARALPRRRVAASPDGYGWEWADQDRALDSPLWVVAKSAADLLTASEPERIRQCAGDPCGWLFYDTSRNRRRRWCSMEGCGNRAKARRYYQRHRDSTAGATP